MLDRMNLTIQSCWTAGLTIMKPNMARKASLWQPGSSVLVSEIAVVCATIRQVQAKYDHWAGTTKGQRVLAIHPSGDIGGGGPMALAKATPKQMGSVAKCDYLSAAMESVTAAAARAAWAPLLLSRGRGPQKSLKRLQTRGGKNLWSSRGSGSHGRTRHGLGGGYDCHPSAKAIWWGGGTKFPTE